MKKLIVLIYFALIVTANLLPLSLARVSADATNLIANPSVETVDPSNSGQPQGWLQGGWGTNTSSLTYPNTGHTGSRSIEVQTTSYTSGDAKWYFNPVAVTAGSQYIYSDYYQSNIASDLVVQYDNGNGSYSYADMGTQPASSSWKQVSFNLTVPAGEKNLTVFHLINSVGWLQTDDFSLTAYTAPSAPTVSVNTPTANSTLSGTMQLSAAASDSSGIANVQFKVDGSNVGSSLATSPYQTNWDTTTVSNGSHTITATATNTNNVSTTSAPIQVTVNNQLPAGSNLIGNPSFETPSASNPSLPAGWNQGGWGTNTTTYSYVTNGGHTGSHSAEVQITSYTSGDAKWYFNTVPVTAGTQYTFSDYYESNIASDIVAQFDDGNGNYSYVDFGSQPASSTWKQASVNFTVPAGMKNVTVFHLISGVGTLQIDDASLSASTAPTISVTAPSANATVSGTVQLTATASAPAGVKSVQFKVDGVNQGAAITASPYQTSWDTTKAGSGAHTITAVVTDKNKQTATSATVSVTVNNGGNLFLNPSVETANPSNSQLPQGWGNGTWGTNSTTFSYLKSGHTGKRSLEAQVTSYTSGSSFWFYSAPVTVSTDTQYQYSDYYKSNVSTEVEADFNMSDGSIDYEIIGMPSASSQWTKFSTDFSVPLGAQSVTIYHYIDTVGYLTTDDFSLQTYQPVGFSRALVTLTFDDGYDNEYTQALPLLQKYGFDSTQFIITDEIGQPGYLTTSQLDALYGAGNEIASHTVTHDDLAQESSTQLQTELSQSQSQLKQWIGAPVPDLAYPFGSYNSTVIQNVKKYYQAARGVEDGLNSKDNFNAYDLKVQDVYDTTTTAQISDWVKQAQMTNTWLILVYHSVDPTGDDGSIYNVTPTQLDDQLSAIKTSGVTVETMAQALSEITPQLSVK